MFARSVFAEVWFSKQDLCEMYPQASALDNVLHKIPRVCFTVFHASSEL